MTHRVKIARDGDDLVLPLTDELVAELDLKLDDDLEVLSASETGVTFRCSKGIFALTKSINAT